MINTTAEPVPVVVQTSTPEIVEIIENSVSSPTPVDVFTVPANRRLIITDVMMSTNSGSSNAEILRDGTPATAFINVSSGNTFSHSFATGIEFVANETVAVDAGSGTNINFYLRGYLTTE